MANRAKEFPAPIPNPLNDRDDEKTDPNMASPQIPGVDLGPLTPFMADPSITEVMVNDLRAVMIERDGKIISSGFSFKTNEEINRVIQQIVELTKTEFDPSKPFFDVVLPDRSRVNIVYPPVSERGPCITIRKFTQKPKLNQLIAGGTLTNKLGQFLKNCVSGQLNLLVSGGTGSGKTTLLNALSTFIPSSERIISIEDTSELQLPQLNSVKLLTKKEANQRELIINALRMRPDRIILGECRNAEALDILQAMNTGHNGSMTTIHGNSPRDALSRLETLCLMSDVNLPLPALRKQISSALDLVIHIQRNRGGQRIVSSVVEITGMEGQTFTLQEIYGLDKNGLIQPSGFIPTFATRLRLTKELF